MRYSPDWLPNKLARAQAQEYQREQIHEKSAEEIAEQLKWAMWLTDSDISLLRAFRISPE